MDANTNSDERELIRAFALAARRFCTFVEDTSCAPPGLRLRDARKLLADIVAAGAVLPVVDDAPEIDESDISPPATWVGFGLHDIYWEVFDPYVDAERVAGSLTDDVLDIYLDLSRGLRAFDAGNELGAAWDWRFHFDWHWGNHAVDALRALHRACTRSKEADR